MSSNFASGDGDIGELSAFQTAATHLKYALAALDHANADVAAAFVSMALDCCDRELGAGKPRIGHQKPTPSRPRQFQ